MPNTTISLYLKDEDYIEYVKNKQIINEELREVIRRKLRKYSALKETKTEEPVPTPQAKETPTPSEPMMTEDDESDDDASESDDTLDDDETF